MATEFATNNCTNSVNQIDLNGYLNININHTNLKQLDNSKVYIQEYIDMFDRTLEQVLDIDTSINLNQQYHHAYEYDNNCSTPISLSLENFNNLKNDTFSTYLDNIELDDNTR